MINLEVFASNIQVAFALGWNKMILCLRDKTCLALLSEGRQ
jgi:hypothetical protein